jgi:hypothetical protein
MNARIHQDGKFSSQENRRRGVTTNRWCRFESTARSHAEREAPCDVVDGHVGTGGELVGAEGAEWSRHSDLNRGPAVYETAALPLSYVGASPE